MYVRTTVADRLIDVVPLVPFQRHETFQLECVFTLLRERQKILNKLSQYLSISVSRRYSKKNVNFSYKKIVKKKTSLLYNSFSLWGKSILTEVQLPVPYLKKKKITLIFLYTGCPKSMEMRE